MPTMGGGPGTGLTPFLVNLPLFFVMVLSIAIIVTWVFNHTKGSIFTSTVLHTSIDMPQAVLLPLFLAVSYTSLFIGGVIGFGVTALLIVILTRGRLGYQLPHSSTQIRNSETLSRFDIPTNFRQKRELEKR
jgi:CAAX protease family protein